MGWFNSADTIDGKIIDVEFKAFHSQITFDIKMPKAATLIQIQDSSGKNYLAFLAGKVDTIKVDQKISCTVKQPWNAYWVNRDDDNTRVMPADLFARGNAIYRQIKKYDILN